MRYCGRGRKIKFSLLFWVPGADPWNKRQIKKRKTNKCNSMYNSCIHGRYHRESEYSMMCLRIQDLNRERGVGRDVGLLEESKWFLGKDEWVLRRIGGRYVSLWHKFVWVWYWFLVSSAEMSQYFLVYKTPWAWENYDNLISFESVFRQEKEVQRKPLPHLLVWKCLWLKIINIAEWHYFGVICPATLYP